MTTTLQLLSGGAAHGLVAAVTGHFTAETQAEIHGTYTAVGAIRDKVVAGAAADVVILSRALIDALIASGELVAGSAVDLGVVRTAVAVRACDAMPPIRTADELRDAFRAADAIYTPDTKLATAGIHVQRILEALGIAAEVQARLKVFPNGTTAMGKMAEQRGGQPIGVTQVTEILHTPGLAVVGNLPAEYELATTYTAAVATRAAAPELARRLIAMMTADDTAGARRKAGFDKT